MSESGKSQGFAPGNGATGKPLNLSMQKLWLTGQVLAVGARFWVRHEFVSSETSAEFEQILDLWLEAHRTGCKMYRGACDARHKGRE